MSTDMWLLFYIQAVSKLADDDSADASDDANSVHSDTENDASKTSPVVTRRSTRRSNASS